MKFIGFKKSTVLLKLNKGRDTIYFKARLNSIGKISHTYTLKTLHKKGFINKKNFNTALNIMSLQSNLDMYLPYKDTDPIIYKRLVLIQSQKKSICIRGIVIKGFEKVNNKPFF
ncbi:hypothetical protein BH09BAC2_BH09BAC2_20460 [soil metagenome]